ncbi:hypothetical protein F511_06430 [Dorcoceras hygrometricum]|uniref:Uncharacterized protein n=1 Tax=Dorcoceras hygrometricum TaxID=472368 RepID=A0A2Z7ART7_9LAMI|nr:hypothetical protein F511_06430 [Dorcoceras hygrometricum]
MLVMMVHAKTAVWNFHDLGLHQLREPQWLAMIFAVPILKVPQYSLPIIFCWTISLLSYQIQMLPRAVRTSILAKLDNYHSKCWQAKKIDQESRTVRAQIEELIAKYDANEAEVSLIPAYKVILVDFSPITCGGRNANGKYYEYMAAQGFIGKVHLILIPRRCIFILNMDPKHSGDLFKHLEKQNELLMDAYRSMSHELHRLQVEEEMLMRKYYEYMAAQGLIAKQTDDTNLRSNKKTDGVIDNGTNED